MESDHGCVLIVSGSAGSGRTALLRAATQALRTADPPPVVLAGRIASREDGHAGFVTWEEESAQAPAKEALGLLQSTLALGGQLVPVLALLGELLGASRAARDLLQQIRESGKAQDPLQLVPDILRAAAREHRCACLIDDADTGTGTLWRDLEFSFATEIAQQLPLLLVLSIRDREGEPEGADEADAQRMARRLEERRLAERVQLESFTQEDLREWLGPADRDVVSQLLAVTWGRPGLVSSVWANWIATGSVERATGDGRWVFTPAADDAALGSVSTALRTQLERVTTDFERDAEFLRCGALEGRQFTAEVIAAALRRDRDEVNDALDQIVERQEEGCELIMECPGVAVGFSNSRPRQLWPYRFVSPWHWLALRATLSETDRETLAARVADAMIELYEAETWRVARSIAELSRLAGRPADATRYQRMADFAGPDDELASEARRILSAETRDWDAWECERAGWVLIEAEQELRWSAAPSDLRAYARRAFELGKRAGSGPLQVHALFAEAKLETRLAEFDAAREHFALMRRTARDISDRAGEAEAIAGVGNVENECLNPRAAEPAYREALSRFEGLGDLHGQAQAHRGLGYAAMMTGDLEGARVEHELGLKLRRRLGDDFETADSLLDLAIVDAKLGSRTTGAAYYREAVELERTAAHPWLRVKALQFGAAAAELHDYDAARQHFTCALRDGERRRDPSLVFIARTMLERLDAWESRRIGLDDTGARA
jgi:hypothetical protein